MPCAVDPEDRRLPAVQTNPDPSKVGAAPPPAVAVAAAEDTAALAPDFAEDTAALAPDVAAEVAAADDVLAVVLSLPQALSVNAPTATRVSRPLIRVIFTHSSIECHDDWLDWSPVRETVDHRVRDRQHRTVGAADGQPTLAG